LHRDDGSGRFIEPPSTGEHYELAVRRTGRTIAIAPDMTFEQAGVEDGDTIEVRLAGQGACLSFFTSSSEYK
jgi:hypothetical protein